DADGREPAVGRRRKPGRDRLRVLVARLAEVRVEVDEPWRDDYAARVRAAAVTGFQPRDRFQHTVADDDLARPFAPARGVDQPRAAEVEAREQGADRGLVREQRGLSHGRPPADTG